jgi:hypothetical protein
MYSDGMSKHVILYGLNTFTIKKYISLDWRHGVKASKYWLCTDDDLIKN